MSQTRGGGLPFQQAAPEPQLVRSEDDGNTPAGPVADGAYPPPPPTCDCWEARSWRRYWSPAWVAYRAWLLDYEVAQRIRQASYDVCEAMFPRRQRGNSPTEAERVGAVLNEVAERYGEFEPAGGP